MIYLLLVSFIWAFSFGLMKNISHIDSNLLAFFRLSIAAIAFLPWLRLKHLSTALLIKLSITGAIQYGMMYLLLFYSFNYLQAYEVALFTVLTPIYVTIIQDLLNRSFNYKAMLLTILAIIGTVIIKYTELSSDSLLAGFLFMQCANLCFAFGQVYYKHILKNIGIKDYKVFGLLFASAAILSAIISFIKLDTIFVPITANEVYILIYLGLISSGLGFFFWNIGARRVDTTSLAIFNDLKIPLAIAVSLIFFGEETDLMRLIVGGAVIVSALYLNENYVNKRGVERRMTQ